MFIFITPRLSLVATLLLQLLAHGLLAVALGTERGLRVAGVTVTLLGLAASAVRTVGLAGEVGAHRSLVPRVNVRRQEARL